MVTSGMTTPRKLIQQLIFGGSEINEESIEQDLEIIDEERDQPVGAKRPSAYVDVFENTAKIVIEHEPWLLSEPEINALEKFSMLCYNTRYCLIRLVLRKANQWHAVSTLNKYEREVGKEGLLSSIADLCRPIATIVKEEPLDQPIKMELVDPSQSTNREAGNTHVTVKVEDEPEIIDLTMDEDEDETKPNVTSFPEVPPSTSFANTSRLPAQGDPIKALLELEQDDMNLEFFCEDETAMTLDEILWRLNKDQLMMLVKTTKCKLKPTESKKSDIICVLQHTAATQSVLNFGSPQSRKAKGKTRDDGLRQTVLPYAPVARASLPGKAKVTQEERLKQMALKILGKCVRVNFDFFRLVRRLHIICYRETEHPTALLLPALLTVFKKRDYTRYEHSRSTNIWSSRKELLEYETALELETLLDEFIEGSEDKAGRAGTKTPARARDQFVTPMTSGTGKYHTTPLRTPASVANIRSSKTPGVKKEEELLLQDLGEEEDFEGSIIVEVKKEEKIKKHLEEWILPKWQELVARQHARENTSKPPGLERFDSGYIYTRMVHKTLKALSALKEYKAELKILDSLLSQKIWRRGKRAAWYERRAIVLGHLTNQARTAEDKRALQLQTLECIKEALLDNDTGTVSRPGLVKRLMALEKRLKIPLSERSICEGELRMAVTKELRATKLDPLKFDLLGHPVGEKENTDTGIHAYISVIKAVDRKPKEPTHSKQKLGKSRWKGRNGQIVNVETRALESYEDQGFTGFHCETKILTTIFGLLFWDIIFATVPGAFETPFQVAPLDMFEESFYRARNDLINKRLEEIRNDSWREILQKHDDAYRKDKTWCIGVSWDLCGKEDLLDIFECIGKESLAIICQLFCEDYKGRSSGGPDLFVWKAEQRTCKFVEVKGPGDRPQENQKYWFDSLLRAKVDVEICKVIDDSAPPTAIASSKKRKAKVASTAPRRKKNAPVDDLSEEEDNGRLDAVPEGGADFLAPNPPDPPSSRKRRRISAPDFKIAYPEGMDDLPFATTSSSSHIDSSPSPHPRPNRVEVVLTPPKRSVKKS